MTDLSAAAREALRGADGRYVGLIRRSTFFELCNAGFMDTEGRLTEEGLEYVRAARQAPRAAIPRRPASNL